MRELFVWYRVSEGQREAARVAVLAMQQALRTRTAGLRARLLVRTDAQGSTQTWMETYAVAGSKAGVDNELEAAIEIEAAMTVPLIDGPRHSEAFTLAAMQLENPQHLDVGDAGLVEHRAAAREAGPLVERRRR